MQVHMQHTLANPGESAVLDCHVLRKVGECRYIQYAHLTALLNIALVQFILFFKSSWDKIVSTANK